MNLFGLCPHCELPIFLSDDISFCPFCKQNLPDDDEDFAEDSLAEFLRTMKNAIYFEWDDIQRLLYFVETMININTNLSEELGIALMELHKAKERLVFYRKATTFRIK